MHGILVFPSAISISAQEPAAASSSSGFCGDMGEEISVAECVVARKGRHQQRYDQGYRLIAGCIPYQLKRGCNGSLEPSVEILMVSSLNGRGLVLPKGGWELDETVEAAACREAVEEAGVRGLIKEELGYWTFTSKRLHRDVSPQGFCKAYMFALEVTQELEIWPEQQVRRREWFTITSAIEKCRHVWMREALEKCHEYLQKLHHPNLSNQHEQQGFLERSEIQKTCNAVPKMSFPDPNHGFCGCCT